jgi:hypothetical protein
MFVTAQVSISDAMALKLEEMAAALVHHSITAILFAMS